MKKNSLAVAFTAVAFLFPVQSFAETAKVGDVTWGFRTDKRLNDMTSLWEPKQIGILDKKTGITHITTITKVACVLDECLYRTEYKGSKGKKQNIQVFDIEDVAPKNLGNKDVAENAKKLGVDKEKLKKALEDENEYQRLLREIQVKKEQQRRKEEEEKKKNKNNGSTGNGGGGGGGSHGGGNSSGGGGSHGGGNSSGGGGSNGSGNSSGGGGSNGSGNSSGGGGSNGSGNSSGGGGSNGSGQGSDGGGSSGKKGSKKAYYGYGGNNGYFESPSDACSATYSGLEYDGEPVVGVYSGGLTCKAIGVTSGEEKHSGELSEIDFVVDERDSDSFCKDGGKHYGDGFSVICTVKHKPKQESSTVSSTSPSSSTSESSSNNSSPNSSSAGGGGGGGRSGAGHATTPDGGMQGGGKNGGSGQGGTSGSGGQGGTSGSGGGGGGGQDSELPEMPDSPFGNGDGEPDWGGLKSNGDFGTFRPSSAFSTGGACPQDLTLDFGQFGVHQLPMSYVCMAVEKLRYVFIFIAYLVSAMMVFRTVNSMKG